MIFTDIVENYPRHRAYPDALFLLADSLFRAGDLLVVNGTSLEVLIPTSGPTPGENLLTNVRLRALSSTPLNASDLLGSGTFKTPYEPGLPISDACFLSFQPKPLATPDRNISKTTQITLTRKPADMPAITPSRVVFS